MASRLDPEANWSQHSVHSEPLRRHHRSSPIDCMPICPSTLYGMWHVIGMVTRTVCSQLLIQRSVLIFVNSRCRVNQCSSDYVIFQLSNGFIVLQITIWAGWLMMLILLQQWLRYSTSIAAFSSLRVYGICGRQWKIPLLVIIFGMVPAISNLVSTYVHRWMTVY